MAGDGTVLKKGSFVLLIGVFLLFPYRVKSPNLRKMSYFFLSVPLS